LKNEEAARLIKKYATACAVAVGGNILPASDALILAPLQVGMIIHLGKLYGIHLTAATAAGLLGTVGLSFTGRIAAQGILSFFPGLKNLVGPGLAYGLTWSLGLVVNDLFQENRLGTSREEMEELARRHREAGETAAQEFTAGGDPSVN
jgi:uncharacterized protein (DUF697 family)